MSWRKLDPKKPDYLAKLCEAALALDAERKALQKETDAKGEEVKEAKEAIRLAMNASLSTEVKTKLGAVRLVPKDQYQMDSEAGGWPKIWAYITKHKAFDLVEKRLHQTACKARFEDGEKIPGVKVFPMVHVKLGDAE